VAFDNICDGILMATVLAGIAESAAHPSVVLINGQTPQKER
jgi:hypothetical protein